MPQKPRIPSFRLHRPTGQAVVTLNGKDHYLGRYDEPNARAEYDRLIADWCARGRALPVELDVAALAIVELCARFLQYARDYYRDLDTGEPGREYKHYPTALKPLTKSYGRTPAAEFGPLRFKAVRDAYIAEGWSRKHVNQQADRIKRMFRWAVGEELVPPSVYEALRAVPGLKRGRTQAPDHPAVMPVAIETVAATKAHLSKPLALVVDLQLLTAARPGEILNLQPKDIDRSDKDVWVYRPTRHKTALHGHERRIYFGPKAQALLAPYLLNRGEDDFIISPRDAVDQHLQRRSVARTTPLSCGNKPGSNRKWQPKRTAGKRYDTNAYRRAIERACERAFPAPSEVLAKARDAMLPTLSPEKQRQAYRREIAKWEQATPDAAKAWRELNRWHPHQLRHTAATELRRELGLEVASILMGHRDVGISQVYAMRDELKAREVARKVG